MNKPSILSRPVTDLPGVGSVKEKCFARLGIFTLRDLLYHFPRGYQHRGDVRTLADAAVSGETRATVLVVGTRPATVMLSGRRTITKFTAFDSSGKCSVIFFNMTYVEKVFQPGACFRFFGKVKKTPGGSGYELTSPAFEQVFESRPLPEFVPVYPLTAGLTGKAVASAVAAARETARAEKDLHELLPQEVRARHRLPSFMEAMDQIHSPANYEALDRARNYFIFEELYLFSLAAAGIQRQRETEAFPGMRRYALTPFLSALPFALTAAQKKAIGEIVEDMTSPEAKYPMSRLLSGDVGSGKTVCAAAAVYEAVKNGFQAAIMVPTEILAIQHYKDLSELLSPLGVRVELLTGALRAVGKRRLKERCLLGQVDLLIGTHALLTGDTVFQKLGLVITDEQHRFGVMQRAGLSEKGKGVHTLVMTATPIPRTLALILYDGLSVSRIDELPPGRQKVDTFVVNEGYRKRLCGFIEKQIGEGHQVYIVCPAVDGGEDGEEDEGTVGLSFRPEEEKAPKTQIKDVMHYAEKMQSEWLPEVSVGILHGRMKGKEKEAVMERFTAGEIQVLVSTTVVEVGVNNPNATLMIVENAERFGLAALHQLRGRVGRGKAKSYCVLVSDAEEGSVARARLNVLRRSSSGFEIAEEDLRLRGPGDFFPSGAGGARQHGEISFRMAQFCGDTALLRAAAEEAKRALEKDPTLSLAENRPAAEELKRLLQQNIHAMN